MIREEHNFSLKKYNSFGFEVQCSRFITFEDENDARDYFQNAYSGNNNMLILGGGSNLLFTKNFKGVIVHSIDRSIRIIDSKSDSVTIEAGAGLVWDDFVDYCVSEGFGDVENLSKIPGTVGAAPVQNIGAYGVEAEAVIEKVFYIDIRTGEEKFLSHDECQFGYRDSIFKRNLSGNAFVTKVVFKLSKQHQFVTHYGDIEERLERKYSGIKTIRNIREIIIEIRKEKLPDPEIIGNAGSFFKNPVISEEKGDALKAEYPKIPIYQAGKGLVKVAAGWMIDQCGWKGYRAGDAGVHEKQALVLVNYGNASGAEIVKLASEIQKSVNDKFGIAIEPEVIEIS